MSVKSSNAVIQRLNSYPQIVDVMRLDLSPMMGNKGFKLKHHIREAFNQSKKVITFGGSHSNHLYATALACRAFGLACVGLVRGERRPSPTLDDISDIMHLYFVDRRVYRDKAKLMDWVKEKFSNHYVIPEGGQSNLGILGCEEILRQHDTSSYTHVMCSVGTGTTMIGLINSSLPHQKVIGISSLKLDPQSNNIDNFIEAKANKKNFSILYDYHFGGYARYSNQLINFMNDLHDRYELPTDFVYTGKLLFAVFDLIEAGYFRVDDRILIIHSGGIQGNRGLPSGALHF